MYNIIRMNTVVERICGLIGFILSTSFIIRLIKDFIKIGIHSNAEVLFALFWVVFCLFSLFPLLFRGKIVVHDSYLQLYHLPRFIKKLLIKDIRQVYRSTIDLNNIKDLNLCLEYGCFAKKGLYMIETTQEKILISIDKRDLAKWEEIIKKIRENHTGNYSL